MAVIHYTDFPMSISEGTQGALWRRTWRADGIVATDRVDAIAELFLALPDRGTSVPSPLNPNMRVIENGITWMGELDGANGEAKGYTVNSTPVDSITAAPPELGQEDTGPGITLSGRGYVQQTLLEDARPVGGNNTSVEQIFANWSNGVPSAMPIQAPEYGEAYTFNRTEQTNPVNRLRLVRGRLNDATWNGRLTDTVLLADAEYETVNGGEYYNVSYEFVEMPNGFAVPVTGRDIEKGTPILNPTGDQRRFYVPYLQANFAPLNIVLP